MKSRRRSPAAATLIVVAVGAFLLSGCQFAKAGQRCTKGAAEDGVNVLVCKNHRWTVWMTKAAGQRLLDAWTAEHLPPPPPAPAPPAPPSNISGRLLDPEQFGPSSLVLEGWAWDTFTSEPMTVQITEDGVGKAAAGASDAGMPPAVNFPSSIGGNHGFTVEVANIPSGLHRLCAVATRPSTGATSQFGCVDAFVAPESPIGTTTGLLENARYRPGLLVIGGYVNAASTVVDFSWGPPQIGSGGVVANSLGIAGTPISARGDRGPYSFGFHEGDSSAEFAPNTAGATTLCMYAYLNPGAGASCRPLVGLGF